MPRRKLADLMQPRLAALHFHSCAQLMEVTQEFPHLREHAKPQLSGCQLTALHSIPVRS